MTSSWLSMAAVRVVASVARAPWSSARLVVRASPGRAIDLRVRQTFARGRRFVRDPKVRLPRWDRRGAAATALVLAAFRPSPHEREDPGLRGGGAQAFVRGRPRLAGLGTKRQDRGGGAGHPRRLRFAVQEDAGERREGALTTVGRLRVPRDRARR